MAAEALIDAGAILALADRSDRWHSDCTEALSHLRVPMVTSLAVLAEVFHLVMARRLRMEATWGLVRSGILELAAIDDSELAHIHGLMSQYWDRPMDFADATLVYLAERESISTIFTIDHNDFGTYRIGGRKRFRMIPSRRT